MNGLQVIAQGRTAEIAAYGNGRIIKIFRPGIPIELIEEEYAKSSQVYRLGVTTPEPVELIAVGERKGIVYEYVRGSTLLAMISRKPWRIAGESEKLAKLHYELHQKEAGGIARQKDVLTYHIRNSPLLADEEKERIIRYLDGLEEGAKLCHGDFHPDNVIAGEKLWVIDWTTGTCGNPAGDVARSILMYRLAMMPDGTSQMVNLIFGLVRQKILKAYSKRYFQISGMSPEEVERWMLPVAAARLVERVPQKEKELLLALVRQRLKDI